MKLPALRERREDIPLLARHFADRQAVTNGLPRTESVSYTHLDVYKRQAQRAALVLEGTSPQEIGVTEITQGFIYDYKPVSYTHLYQS